MFKRPCVRSQCYQRLFVQAVKGNRHYQSTSTSPEALISPALLGRARTLAAEHALLSKQLTNHYDTQVAKKVGTLTPVATVFSDWENASNVCFFCG